MRVWRWLPVLAVVIATSVVAGGAGSDHHAGLDPSVLTAGSVTVASRPTPTTAPPETTTTTTTEAEPPVTTTLAPPPPTTQAPAPPPAPAVSSSSYPPECDNPVVPPRVAWGESHCLWDNYNPAGCNGRGCLGYFQLDEGHFYEVSPWNANVSGSCVDLAAVKWEQWAQIECASRLGPGAWG